MSGITYTFPMDCPVAELRGVTVTGGRPGMFRGSEVVNFTTEVAGRPVTALVAGKPELEAAVAAYRNAEEEAEAAYRATPRGQREALVMAEADSYSPDAFPGSRQWIENKKAADALAAFDRRHPEVKAEMDAERAAAEKARYESLSEFVKSGS